MDTSLLRSAGSVGEPAPVTGGYRIVRRLGHGGGGVVFEAIDPHGESVALKMLPRFDAEMLLSLKAEFRGVQDIRHPNLVSLGELVSDGETCFFTMELVVGEDFRAAMRTPGGGFDEARLRRALPQLAMGLAAIHAAGKVHRDVKPSNVLVTADDRVVVLDFGLVTETMHAGDDEGVVGTVPYMAPEQSGDDTVTAAADWYAFGVVLYEILTGRLPFVGDMTAVLAAKYCEVPAAPHSVVSHPLPADLEALCIALLRPHPGDRATGAEVLAQLAPSDKALPRTAGASSSQRILVGREREVDRLRASFAATRNGETRAVVVEGESGLGKSALVRYVAGLLADEDGAVLVLKARCYERESVPFKAVDGVVDALSRFLASSDDDFASAVTPDGASLLERAFPVMRSVEVLRGRRRASAYPTVPGQDDRARLHAAFRALLGAIARARPLVIVIDDLHWADEDSLALLSDLLRPPESPPLLLLATARPRAAAKEAFGLPGAETLRLTRLSADEARLLVLETLGEGNAAAVEAILSEADGHPMFLSELARHARERAGAIAPAAHLDEVIAERVAQLEPSARRVVEVLAVAGVMLPQATVARAAGLGFGAFVKEAEVLRAASLARTDVAGIEPYHDRVRESVYERLSPPTRRSRHEALARALEEGGAGAAEMLATHWLEAGFPAKAGAYELAAAERAEAALAFERAARLYEGALERAELDEAKRGEVWARLGSALANAGLARAAARAFAEAAARKSGAEALDLRRRAGEALLLAGDVGSGLRIIREVLATVRVRYPETMLALVVALLLSRALLAFESARGRARAAAPMRSPTREEVMRFDACFGSARALSMAEPIRGVYFQTRALLFALDMGEPRRLAMALAGDGGFSAARGDEQTAGRVFALAGQLAAESGDARALAMVLVTRGLAAHVLGRFKEGLELSDEGAGAVESTCPEAFWELRTARITAMWALAYMGRWRALRPRVERGQIEARYRGDLAALLAFSSGIAAFASIAVDDVAGGRARAEDAFAPWREGATSNPHWWDVVAGVSFDLYEQRGDDAEKRLVDVARRVSRTFLRVRLNAVKFAELSAQAALVVAQQAQGSRAAGALQRAESAISRLGAHQVPYARALSALHGAGACAARGEREGAVGQLKKAIVLLEGADLHVHAAAARTRLGWLLGGEEGAGLVEAGTSWMRGEAIAVPEEVTRFLTPGYDGRA